MSREPVPVGYGGKGTRTVLLGDKVIWCVNASLPAPAAVVLRSGSISAGVVAAGMASNLPRRQLRVHRGPLPRLATRIRPRPPLRSSSVSRMPTRTPAPPLPTHPPPASCPMRGIHAHAPTRGDRPCRRRARSTSPSAGSRPLLGPPPRALGLPRACGGPTGVAPQALVSHSDACSLGPSVTGW